LPAHYLTLQWVTGASTEIVSSCNCNYIIDGCDSTALCGGQFQCLNTTCYNGTIASLYDETECNGECPSLLSSRISSTIESEEYFEDPNNTCCTLDALDCAGYCQVGIVIRIQPMFNDCAGVCGGSHIINPCGICTKTDPTGSSCFNSRQLIIQTHHSDGNVYLQFNYSDSLETSASILLMNTGIFDLTISLYLSSSPSFYPILTFPSSIHLAALSNISIFINASFDGLAEPSNEDLTWAVKQVTFRFTRTKYYNQPSYTKAVNVYPVGGNCEGLSKDACAQLPGCIYCSRYTGGVYFLPNSGGSSTSRKLEELGKKYLDSIMFSQRPLFILLHVVYSQILFQNDCPPLMTEIL
jgi:hypothetical protein